MPVDWPKRAQEFLEELEARTFFKFTYDDPIVGVMHFQRIAGLRVDGKAGGKTFGMMRSLFSRLGESQDPFAGWVYPVPRWEGVSPIISSGFVDDRGRGPNQWRYRDNVRSSVAWRRKYPGHLGVDIVYRWDGEGERPETLFEGQFYCPPVPVYAMGPGVVEYAKLYGRKRDRYAIQINHGHLPGWGHCATWSVHHKAVHVAAGDKVVAGTVIATAGDTGAKGAPHVHQEIWQWQRGEVKLRRHKPRDPAPVLARLEVKEAGSVA